MKKPEWVKGVGRWLYELRAGHFWQANLISLILIMLGCIYGAVWLSTPSGQTTAPRDLGKSIPWLVFGALFAAILGLFRDAIGRLIWFPDLDLRFENAAPCCVDPPDPKPDDNGFLVPTIWFRALVVNRGTARAEKVEVMVTGVDVLQEGKPPTTDRQYFLNLGWSYSSGAPRDGKAVLVWDGLNPGMCRFVDLGKIYEPSARRQHCGARENLSEEDGTLFCVLIEYKNTKGFHLLRSNGNWRLTLLVSAANHKTRYYHADIRFKNGEWIDGMDKMLDRDTGNVRVDITPTKRKWW